MNKIKNNLKLIGNTPLVKIDIGIAKINLLAKLESYNLTGSIKDRMALYLIKKAQKKGWLKKGFNIIEATTGNTGIALAALANIYGYNLIVTIPEDVSKERIEILKLYGAKVILTPKAQGPKGAIKMRDKLARKIPDSWAPSQFDNFDNLKSHELGIGKEILNQVKGRIDYVVHGIGTGGTLMGISKVIKENYPKVKIIAVEPEESAVLSGRKPGHHGIQGIGEGFVPKLVKRQLIDLVIRVSSHQAIVETKSLARTNGLLVGFSSGANISAIKKLAKGINKQVRIVTVFADGGERYLSVLEN